MRPGPDADRMDPAFPAAVEKQLSSQATAGGAWPMGGAARSAVRRTALVTAVVLALLVAGTVAVLHSTGASVPAGAGSCATAATTPFCAQYRLAAGERGSGDLRTLRDTARLLVVRDGTALRLRTLIAGRSAEAGTLVRAAEGYRAEEPVDFQVLCGRRPLASSSPASAASTGTPCPGVTTVGFDWTLHPDGDRLVVTSGPDSVELVSTTSAPPPTATPSPAITGSSKVDAVAWQPLPPGPEPTTSRVEPTSAAPLCGAAGLTVTDRRGGGALGTFYQLVDVTNRSGSACTLTEAALRIDHGGDELTVPSSLGRSGQHGFVLAGRSMLVLQIVLPQCGGTLAGSPADTASVRIGSVDVPLRYGVPDRLATGCTEQDGRRVTPSFVQDGVPDAVGPYDALRATVTMPVTVHAGSTVDYTVRLADPTGAPIRFATCPTYDEIVATTIPHRAGVITTRYTLNCAGAQTIPAHGATDFAMRIAVPSGATGLTKLSWVLETTGGFVGDTALRTLG